MLACACGGFCWVISTSICFIASATLVAINCMIAERREDLN